MRPIFRGIALVLAVLFLWVLPQIVAGIGSGGPVQTVFDVIAATGAVLMAPLFVYYAVRGPEAADRMLARFGIRKEPAAPQSSADSGS